VYIARYLVVLISGNFEACITSLDGLLPELEVAATASFN
jgi:hypothetical protein